MTDKELAAIEARAAGIFMPEAHAEVRARPMGVFSFSPYDPHSMADAEFHAHARRDVPELIAEVRRLQGALEMVLSETNDVVLRRRIEEYLSGL